MDFKKKVFICNFLFFVILSISAIANETELYKFGKQSNHVFVLTSSKSITGGDTEMIFQLRKLATFFEENPPNYTVIIAFTSNDVTDLPSDIPLKLNSGIKLIMDEISQYLNASVLILENTEMKTKIIAGANGITSPDWLASDVYSQLPKDEKKSAFNSLSIYSNRLNLIQSDFLLEQYLSNFIPAIKLSTNSDIFDLCKNIIMVYEKGFPNNWDRNYLVVEGNTLNIISEHTMIFGAILVGLFSLFILFIFVFSKSLKFTEKDILKSFIVCVVFFIINIFSFFIAQKLVKLLFFIHFGSFKVIEFFPILGIYLNLSFTFSFILMTHYLVIKKIKKLDINLFILGQFEHIICLINMFIFSFIEIILYPIFFIAYLLSIFYSKTKNILAQWVLLTLVFSVFLILFLLIKKDLSSVLSFLFSYKQLFLSFLILPMSVGITRTYLFKINNKVKHYFIKFIPLLVSFSLLMIGIIIVFFIKPYSKNKPLEIYIHQLINNSTVKNKLISDFKFSNDILFLSKENTNVTSSDYLEVKTNFDNYLERSIGQIIITSPLNIEGIEVIIENKNGFAVYETSEFISNKLGSVATFVTKPKPELPIKLNFSSENNAVLHITIRAWSYDNPLATKIKKTRNQFFNEKFLLELKREFTMQEKSNSE